MNSSPSGHLPPPLPNYEATARNTVRREIRSVLGDPPRAPSAPS